MRIDEYAKFRRRYKTDPIVGLDVEYRAGRSRSGVVYLAIGAEHTQLALLSISQLRVVGYDGPIRVLTDVNAWPGDDGDVEAIRICPARDPNPPRYYKTQINRFAFPSTLFLDTDVLAIARIDDIWSHLRFGDICASLELPRVQGFIDYYWDRERRMRPELEYMLENRLCRRRFYNSGVILFRSGETTDRLYAAWHEEWRRFGGMDQCALVRASARTGVPLHALPSSWNCPAPRFDSVDDARGLGVKFLHYFSGEARGRLEL